MSLSLVIPVYNEEDNIIAFLVEISTVKANLPELLKAIFVDDGSTDKTLEVLKNAKTQFPCLTILHLVENAGKSSDAKVIKLLTTNSYR